MRPVVIVAAALLTGLAGAAAASSPAAWRAAEAKGRSACLTASGLREARTSAGVPFNDTVGRTAYLVQGRWPQPHMKNRTATMLCLYDRRSGVAEASESPGWSGPIR